MKNDKKKRTVTLDDTTVDKLKKYAAIKTGDSNLSLGIRLLVKENIDG